MLQHASLEVAPAQVEDCVAFWGLLGFTPMDPPPKLRSRFTWVEREGTQIHLIPAEDPVRAREGHVAVVAPDYEAALTALRGAGFEPYDGENAWNAPRSFVRDPAGHLVEVMSAPPHPPWQIRTAGRSDTVREPAQRERFRAALAESFGAGRHAGRSVVAYVAAARPG